MSSSLNISDVIAHVRNIVNHVRCTVCDKRGGDRIRFVCGHTSCQDCLINTEGCLLCLTPPASLVNPKLDEPLSQRVQNTCDLLNVCQDTFNIDVYRKLRVSEQQKAEKELFPKCIQAPEKYYNKRKSVRTVENKENTYNYIYPGEHISHSDLFMMKKYDNDIQQWLDDSDKIPRKVLADLSVNKQNINKKTKSYQKLSNDSCVDLASFTKPRKRPHSTTSFPLINKKKNFNSKKSKKSEQESPFVTNNYTTVYEHTNNEERGIVLDNEPILIEDSQSQVTHKDKVAVPAGDKEEPDFISLKSDSSLDFEFLYSVNTEKKLFNGVERKETVKAVPFYKKSPLVEHCFHSKGDHKPKSKLDHDSKGVSITIKNNTFITTINISKYEQVVPHKKNVSVQTDLNYIEKIREKKERFESITKKNNVLLLADTRKNKVLQDSLNLPQTQSVENLHELNNISKKKGVTINESDSDESLFEGSSLQVTAEVHRSCEPKDYKGVLREINTSKLSSKSRSKVRCYTPDSNNSSDKENCDPNKYKKQKNGKKNKYSKK